MKEGGGAPLRIGEAEVGPGRPTYIVAEIAQAHDGSLGTAHALVDALADAGVDAVKFQTHIALEESTLDEPFRVRFSRQDDTRYAYWKRMEFTDGQWAGLARHAREKGLAFLSSPFSEKAVRLLRDIGVPAWKLGSGEVRSDSLIEAIPRDGRPILLSTGMSDWREIEEGVNRLRERGYPVVVLQCTSMYPTPLDKVGLNVIDDLRDRFDCPVGLSDHSGTVFPALAGMAGGIDLLEVHVTFHRRMFGPDVPASLTLEEMGFLVQARDAFHTMRRHPVDKDRLARELETTKSMFSKSLAPRYGIPAGTVIERDMLTFKKPGSGIPPRDLEHVVGMRCARDVGPERLLQWEDLEGSS